MHPVVIRCIVIAAVNCRVVAGQVMLWRHTRAILAGSKVTRQCYLTQSVAISWDQTPTGVQSWMARTTTVATPRTLEQVRECASTSEFSRTLVDSYRTSSYTITSIHMFWSCLGLRLDHG